MYKSTSLIQFGLTKQALCGSRRTAKLSIRASVNEKQELPFRLIKRGKVRDLYESDDQIISVTTNRQSAFDRVITHVPFKGQVLNMTAAWWFFKTEHIVRNALLSVPHPNVSIMRKLEVFPVEVIVRGYITGTTNTSLWTIYEQGDREYCGNILPEGLVKNEELAFPIITPTTKGDVDVPISGVEIVERGYMTKEQWRYVSNVALKLFHHGQYEAMKRGLILVDTKYEFGHDDMGRIYLVDEMHTPDSSRYWLLESYEERFKRGEEPEYIDKEFLRLWFKNNCDPYNDEVLPEAPKNLIQELSERYIRLFETITGEEFVRTDWETKDLIESIQAYLDSSKK